MLYEDDTPKLLVNRWLCADGHVIQSKYTHDYQDHVGKNNEYYSADGGLSYQRVSGNLTSLCLFTDDKHEDIRAHFRWGSFLNNYRGDKHWIPLYKLGDSHIQAILETQLHIPQHIKQMFLNEVEYRKCFMITVEETTKD